MHIRNHTFHEPPPPNEVLQSCQLLVTLTLVMTEDHTLSRHLIPMHNQSDRIAITNRQENQSSSPVLMNLDMIVQNIKGKVLAVNL